MENKEKVEIVVDGITVHNPNIVELRKPVTFEGKEIAEIDLSALEDWTGEDLLKAQKEYQIAVNGAYSPIAAIAPEYDLLFDMLVASKATGLPLELFKKLPARDMNQVKAKIVLFFNSEI